MLVFAGRFLKLSLEIIRKYLFINKKNNSSLVLQICKNNYFWGKKNNFVHFLGNPSAFTVI